jgi:hypothetical protein
VRVFGLAYQQFGPWARSPAPSPVPIRLLDPYAPQTILANAIARATAAAADTTAAEQGAAGAQPMTEADAETKSAADVREVRLALERHAAFDAIRNFFFSLTKSITTCASQYPDEVSFPSP